MSSAICFNLDQSKIMSSGNGLTVVCQMFCQATSCFPIKPSSKQWPAMRGNIPVTPTVLNSQNKINPLTHMPILGSSNSASNKDIISNILTNWDTIF